MGRALQVILVQAGLFATTVSIVASIILALRRPPRWPYYLMAKVGMGAAIGIITAVVIPENSVEASWRTGVYVLAVLVYAIGVVGVSRDILIRTAQGRVTERNLRFTALEDRVTAEEHRNTDIEDFADETRQRAAAHGEAREEEHEHKREV